MELDRRKAGPRHPQWNPPGAVGSICRHEEHSRPARQPALPRCRRGRSRYCPTGGAHQPGGRRPRGRRHPDHPHTHRRNRAAPGQELFEAPERPPAHVRHLRRDGRRQGALTSPTWQASPHHLTPWRLTLWLRIHADNAYAGTTGYAAENCSVCARLKGNYYPCLESVCWGIAACRVNYLQLFRRRCGFPIVA